MKKGVNWLILTKGKKREKKSKKVLTIGGRGDIIVKLSQKRRRETVLEN